jgi:hypothetical protein
VRALRGDEISACDREGKHCCNAIAKLPTVSGDLNDEGPVDTVELQRKHGHRNPPQQL